MHPPAISVCICTYKRLALLRELLASLAAQDTQGRFTYSLVVVDNDVRGSAREVVDAFRREHDTPVIYDVEPERNIAAVRNRTLELATGDYLALIDDDERAAPGWLAHLLQRCEDTGADGALGPVLPIYASRPPRWVLRGRFHEKGTDLVNRPLDWRETRTSNALVRRASVLRTGVRFDPRFSRGGEDVDFFMRMMERGCSFVWSRESVVHELIPAERTARAFMLRRALLRGVVSTGYANFDAKRVMKALVAVPLYTIALPFTVPLGHHRTMDLLVRGTEHLGLLMGVAGLDPVRQR
jgi:glycosyltransferase involved in cell wall biosynthesis